MTQRRAMRSLAAAALAGAALALSAAGPVDSASADNWNIRRASPPGIINDYMHRSWLRNERTGGEVPKGD